MTAHPARSSQEDPTHIHGEQTQDNPTLLVFAIRMASILPIAFTVTILALPNDFYLDHLPWWFRQALDKQVAILTLCAGQAGITGLLMRTKGRITPSTYALFVAAAATALAGYRAIGESAVGQTIVITLALSTVPAVWAESISAKVKQIWGFLASQKRIFAIAIVLTLALMAYNEHRTENYIRNWILIPVGILVAAFLLVRSLQLTLRLAFKYTPMLWARLSKRAANAYNWSVDRIRRAKKKPKNRFS